jgi:hypothetical protein
MNREQMKYLKEHLGQLCRVKYDATCQKPTLPKSVVAAKRVVDAWAEQQRTIAAARQARLEKAKAKVWQAILFGDPSLAMKALREFEKFQP